jgi:hypothetical protein
MNIGAPAALYDSIRPDRVEAVVRFGFTERQARFLLHVLVHSGVFLERQYCRLTGLKHGRKTQDFLRSLIDRKFVTVMTPGKLHSGRFYHLQYKPLYEAIGEPDNRHRKPAVLGRMVERLMLLDVVLADAKHTWLGTEKDVAYFRARELWDKRYGDDYYPRLVFGEGDRKTIRYFPDKLPVGIERDRGRDRHVFVYLVRQTIPTDFRVFLLRHADLLRALYEWTIRIVVPRRFRKAASLYRWALRDDLATPLQPRVVDELEWYLRTRHGRDVRYITPPQDLTPEQAARKFSTARFRALERTWLHNDYKGLSGAWSPILKDHLERGRGRIEFMDLPHQYLQRTSLVGVA